MIDNLVYKKYLLIVFLNFKIMKYLIIIQFEDKIN